MDIKEIEEQLKKLKDSRAMLHYNDNKELVIEVSEDMTLMLLLALLIDGLAEIYSHAIEPNPNFKNTDINEFANEIAKNIKVIYENNGGRQ